MADSNPQTFADLTLRPKSGPGRPSTNTSTATTHTATGALSLPLRERSGHVFGTGHPTNTITSAAAVGAEESSVSSPLEIEEMLRAVEEEWRAEEEEKVRKEEEEEAEAEAKKEKEKEKKEKEKGKKPRKNRAALLEEWRARRHRKQVNRWGLGRG